MTALIRGLPKELRRPLVPIPETAAQVLARLEPRRRPLLEDMERALEALRGVQVPRSAWDVERLPGHLRVTFRVRDDRRSDDADRAVPCSPRARTWPRCAPACGRSCAPS